MNQENNTKKDIAEMSDKEILRQQMELLAESNKNCSPLDTCAIALAIKEIYVTLSSF